MATDLDNLTLPLQRGGSMELFDATHAWGGAAARIFLDINKTPNGVYQTGYDPVTMRSWQRYKAFEDAGWSSWRTFDGSTAPDAPLPSTAYVLSGRTDVMINFSVALDPAAVPLASAFTVTGKTITTVGVAPNGFPNGVKLGLNTALATGGSPVAGYTVPAPPHLRSIDGVDVATFSNLAIIG